MYITNSTAIRLVGDDTQKLTIKDSSWLRQHVDYSRLPAEIYLRLSEKINKVPVSRLTFKGYDYQLSETAYHRNKQCENLSSNYQPIVDRSFFYRFPTIDFQEFKDWYNKLHFPKDDSAFFFLKEAILKKYNVDLGRNHLNIRNSGITPFSNLKIEEKLTLINKLISLLEIEGPAPVKTGSFIFHLKDEVLSSSVIEEILFKTTIQLLKVASYNPQLDSTILDVIGLKPCAYCCSPNRVNVGAFITLMAKSTGSNNMTLDALFMQYDKALFQLHKKFFGRKNLIVRDINPFDPKGWLQDDSIFFVCRGTIVSTSNDQLFFQLPSQSVSPIFISVKKPIFFTASSHFYVGTDHTLLVKKDLEVDMTFTQILPIETDGSSIFPGLMDDQDFLNREVKLTHKA